MHFNKELIIQEFDLYSIGRRGWYRSDKLICPNCQKNDEFNLKFNEDGSAMLHCLHGKSCNNYTTSLQAYLRHIERTDLIQGEKHYEVNKRLEISLKTTQEDIDLTLPIKKPPYYYKPIIFDPYLKSRGFIKEQYKMFNVGRCKQTGLENYLIFLIKFDGEVVGWIGRSKWSKEWHKQNFKEHKENGTRLYPRYKNSPDTDFSKMLLGREEITENTHTVYLVEGVFDKTNVDVQLNLYSSEEIKCCCTFGNSVSVEQMEWLKKTNVRNIVMLYDYGTINQVKHYGMTLCDNGFNVDVGEFLEEKIDAGDADKNYLVKILKYKRNILYFYNTRISLNLKQKF